MPPSTVFNITKKDSGQRLDVFLSKKLKLSRSQTQKNIIGGLVLINEKIPKKSGEAVKVGDVITVQQSSNLSVLKSSASEKKTKTLEDYKIISKPKIIAETSSYVVVNKPTGLIVHPTQAHESNTLVAWLLKKYPEIKRVGDDPKIRPGIVHRLDKEASGLLVVARTQKMFNHLKDQFKNRTVEKEYWALVHGRVAKDWDVLTFPIARSETFDRMAARPLEEKSELTEQEAKPRTVARAGARDSGARDAKTEFFVERRFVNFTLLRVILHTGRMHQIRVHCLAYNHPLVGDPLYVQKKRKSKWDEKLGRLFLHSTKLAFTDLNGERQTFESALPKELDEFILQLK